MASVSRFASCVVHCLSSSPLAAVAENPLTGVRGIKEPWWLKAGVVAGAVLSLPGVE